MVQVVADRLKVDLEHGTMDLVLPAVHHTLKGEGPRTLHQHDRAFQCDGIEALDEVVGIRERVHLAGEERTVFGRLWPDGQYGGGTSVSQLVGHASVKRRVAFLRGTDGFHTVRGEQHGQFEAVRQFQ